MEDFPTAELAACDFSFDISQVIAFPYDDPYRLHPVPPRRKDYGWDPADWDGAETEKKAVFIARSGDHILGYAWVSEYWNGMANLAELAVDRRARGRGVAVALLARIDVWAHDNGFGLIRLETQSNNVAACRLYARVGYALGGFDEMLYAGGPHEGEVALFWYRDLR
ncbi:GNAT family N-acetyltransferase [Sphingopyxis sp. LK2115]|uniref:GNAT family N-acetyltransferase n=1 Tax=Sphingopyxis sp. LK2115 TaxID=2744558 RepID=UPI002948BCE1|nr:GNAT family N-acetyltransferase [Sphingopyxis sp. LK2115]